MNKIGGAYLRPARRTTIVVMGRHVNTVHRAADIEITIDIDIPGYIDIFPLISRVAEAIGIGSTRLDVTRREAPFVFDVPFTYRESSVLSQLADERYRLTLLPD